MTTYIERTQELSKTIEKKLDEGVSPEVLALTYLEVIMNELAAVMDVLLILERNKQCQIYLSLN